MSSKLQNNTFFYLYVRHVYLIRSCKCHAVNGLGLIPGVVQRFDSSNGFRVPHIGWNALQIRKDSEILDDVGDHHVYFVHSYKAIPVCFSR